MTQRRELILYATPTGPLAAACNEYFAAVAALGVTLAQTYPPHCTLTGFFRRDPSRVRIVAEEVQDALADLCPSSPDAVSIVGLHEQPTWIGLELSSLWLADCTAAVVARHQVQAGEDAVRPKDWLHLSLAYGPNTQLDAYAERARQSFSPMPLGGWEVALWERDGQSWIRHTP
jgi:hypothetical protein